MNEKIGWSIHYRPWMGFTLFFGNCLLGGTLRILHTVTPDLAGWIGWAGIASSVFLPMFFPYGPCIWWFDMNDGSDLT